MNNVTRIFIVGQSGAGKGVLAEALAKQLGWKYVDADFAIEPSIGRKMIETLGPQGSEYFYKSLFEILSHQCSLDKIVVTTDDSIVSNENCRNLLSKEFTIHLKVSVPVQLERIGESIGYNRPLLPNNNFVKFLEQLHQEHDDLYEQVASFSLSSDDGNIKEHVASIIKAMKSWHD